MFVQCVSQNQRTLLANRFSVIDDELLGVDERPEQVLQGRGPVGRRLDKGDSR